MLSDERLKRLRQMLLEEQAQLEKGIANFTEFEMSSQDDNVGVGNHLADDATLLFDQSQTVSLRRAHEQRLEDVRAALERMDAGVYGNCERCEQAIDFARLKAVPAAEHCMECQTLVEHR
jgi:DnaK suppressor protein